MRVAKIPYLNSLPFFLGLEEDPPPGVEFVEMAPRELGRLAREGTIDAGLIPVTDFFAVEGRYDRLGPFGIAVAGRVESVLLLSEKPLAALGGARVGLTEASSASVRLLRLLLEVREGVRPAAYVRGAGGTVVSADAQLLIGDEALAATAAGPPAPFVFDLAEEWMRWQGLPFVFAVWVVRKEVRAGDAGRLTKALERSLAGAYTPLAVAARMPGAATDVLAQAAVVHQNRVGDARSGDLKRLVAYLDRFIYRLSRHEEVAIERFRRLLEENDLAGDVA